MKTPLKMIAVAAAVLALMAVGQGGQASMLPRMLSPAYADWIRGPAEMLGFWAWPGPDAMKDQIARTGANATSFHMPMWLAHDEGAPSGVRAAPAKDQLSVVQIEGLTVAAGVDIGEHNNAWFVSYPDWFWQLHPDAAMRDKAGSIIRAGDNPWPAINDPTLIRLARTQMGEMADLLKADPRVRYWVLGGEESYPDYFGLPEGDFRPHALKHYEVWRRTRGITAEPGEDESAWREFRESVLADYYAGYAAFLRERDPSRPILIPTHGNPFMLDFRSKMGYPIADLAGAADGFEAGPISIDDDPERLIRMTLDFQTGFGVPVAAPRLANKQLDPEAQGGGRGFSPESLRRTVYEVLGMGVGHLGLVQWTGALPDGEWGIAGTPAEAESRKVFAELTKAAPYLRGCSRLRPQVGILISDATWRRRWQDRWTLLYDEAIRRGWHVMLLTDPLITPDLAEDTPVILSADNPILAPRTRSRLSEYIRAGGTVLSIGEIATSDGHGHKASPPHGIVRIPDDAPGAKVGIIHQTQTTHGAATWSADVPPLPMDRLEQAITPLADLHPIRLMSPIGHISSVESLLLTDGTHLIAVLINRSAEPRDIRIQPSEQISRHLGKWVARDIITGSLLDEARAHLDPRGTALIRLESRQASPAPQPLVIAPSAKYADGILRICAAVHDPNGKPASKARVRVRLSPGPFEWRALAECQPGLYALSIPRDELPRLYDPLTGQYDLARGLTELVIEVRLGDSQGGRRATVKLR